MADLTPWQRAALERLAGKPVGYAPGDALIRKGCDALTRDGLAERVPGTLTMYRLTTAGVLEHARRERRRAA